MDFMDTITTTATEALENGLLVELTLHDGTDYSGFEVEFVANDVIVIAYGDYDEQRNEARRAILTAEIAEIDLI